MSDKKVIVRSARRMGKTILAAKLAAETISPGFAEAWRLAEEHVAAEMDADEGTKESK